MNMKRRKLLSIILLFFGVISILVGSSLELNFETIRNSTESQPIAYATSNVGEFTYLSDIEYISNQSYTRYDRIRYDEVNGGGKITVKIENNTFSFDRGIWAHATSQVTYDISQYDYKYFTAFVGINTTSNSGNGVVFSISTSTDGKDYGTPKFEQLKKAGENATFVKVDISGAKYLRLVASDNGANGNDHSVYADAKLVNEVDEGSSFKTVEEYNSIIKSQYNGQSDLTGELEQNILKRELIQNVGQYTLNSFYNSSSDNKAVIDWLMSTPQALRYYILGGKPEGTYYNSLTELSKLYRNYKNDFTKTEVTKYGTVLGDLYTRMAISLSLTHSKLVGLWMQASQPENQSDSVRRYAIYRYMHQNGNLNVIEGLDITKWFENYTIEEMRFVMNNNIDDEEILWLNAYTQQFIDAEGRVGSRLTPHPYMAYIWPNYGNPIYYAEENKEYFNDLFSVPDKKNEGKKIGLWDLTYTIPGGVDSPEYTIKITRGTNERKLYKVWMNIRNKFGTGAVCGGISKTGSNIRGVHGIPSAVIGQPGHAAIIYYTQDAQGNGYWNLDNDVSGWAYSEKGERMLLGWGNASFSRGYSVVYMALAQEVINDNDKFEQSEKFVYLANSYKGDFVKQEQAYRKALEIQPLNIDAWYGLITLYNESDDKTEDEYYELAKEIGENLKYFPLPMYHLTNLIKPKLTSIENSYKFALLQTRILTEASLTPNNSADHYYVYQPGLTRLEANHLLGTLDSTIATFSFDGENAEKLVLSSRFDGNGVRWDYSLDGKKTWKEVSFTAEEAHELQLTKKEIESITSENDIYVHIVGVNYDEENLYKIDINESLGLPTNFFASDLENKLLGAVDSLEWKYNENDKWTRYGSKQPELTGDKTVTVRMGATGTYLASNESSTFTFTNDGMDQKRKYIPISHLAVEAFSTEAASHQGSATFALDANYNTRWHSAWNGSDTERYLTVKLDQPYHISAVEFVPAGGGNGKIYDGTIYGSMDGENWMVLSQKKGLTYTNAANTVEQAIQNVQSFDVEIPQRVQYVKIVADRTNGNWLAARAFNFYEDTTIKSVASFSFDGANAGVISLFDDYKNTSWQYSIDNGATWQKVVGDSHTLSSTELEKINEKDKIKIKLGNDKTEYVINIRTGEVPEKGYLNDLENRPIAQPNQESLEWKLAGDDTWTSYKDAEPNVRGNNTLLVRRRATGITTASDAIEYQFTEDNQPKNRRYISVNHLSMYAFSTQSVDAARPFYASNAIDGNMNTLWHTDFRYSVLTQDTKPFLTIKLDEAKYISALEFIQRKYRDPDPDYIKNATVYISMDGENWTQAGRIEDCPQDTELRSINFAKSVQAQYVKLEMETYDIFASVAMINLYEDKTKVPVTTPKAEIKYSTTDLTNKNVVASLVNASTNITVTNNNGKDTYTFTENGEFTFEFVDEDGNKGSAKAVVSNIDKITPTAKVVYGTTELTNKDVVVTLTDASEEITITNNNGSNVYVFTENGEFTFEFVDKAGNANKITATINNIDKEAPTAEVEYSTTQVTNKDVVATLTDASEAITITNNGGKNTYTFTENGTFTFEFIDKAGNKGTAVAKVDWIQKDAMNATISYSTTKLTNKDVVATIQFGSSDVTITNNNGKNTYTFTQNGTFTFEYVDKTGNKGSAIAKVDWIDKKAPTATVTYDIKTLTNKNVVATISLDDKDAVITNNGGKNTYTFTENGAFTFEFTDKAGNKGTTVAKVDWIDKKAPTAIVTYDIKTLTNKNVVATINLDDKDAIITNNGGKNTYTFTQNGTFTFEFVDKAGNKGTATARVDWISKETLAARVVYDITKSTNKNVVATVEFNKSNVKVTNNNGKNTYTFTKNGEFTFEFVDEAGNKGTAVAKVDWIDRNAPKASVYYSTISLTNQNVIATIRFDKTNVKITNNNGSNQYTFTENGEFTFEFVDEAGNAGKETLEVTWIDKTAIEAIVTYDVTKLTNKDVTATINLSKRNARITNNNGKNTYTFTKNGSFTFEFVDGAGNKGTAIAKVDWIDKEAPKATISYDITGFTNKDVTATVRFDEKNVKVMNNNGSLSHTFTKNGSFTFEYVDEAGNKGTAIARVDWIDKSALAAKVTYNTTSLTNQNVVASIAFNKEKVRITNNNGRNTYTFTENGEFTFEYVDEVGNTGRTVAKVNWIDKVAPVATVTYNTTSLTNKDVVATVRFNENATITNNNGRNTYTFTENGEFTFEFVDKAGNKGVAVAKVDWIDKEAPVGTITYNINKLTDKDVVATISFNKKNVKVTNNNGKNTYTFTKNGEFTFVFVDELGNVGHAVAKVDWIEKTAFASRVTYNITKTTNQNVVATLEFNKSGARITNNGGKNTYTFTKNGEFTFEYVDASGNKGKAVAKVNWIDKEVPKATISYDVTTITSKYVVATIHFDKKNVKVVNNDGKNTYVFTENGSFTFEYVDEAGNAGKTVAKVDWIKKADNKPQNKPQNKPSVKPSTKPQTPSTPNTTPSTSVPSVISRPSIAIINGSNNQGTTSGNSAVSGNDKLVDNAEIIYNTYKNGIVSVKIPMDEIKESVSLELRRFELSKSLKEKLGEISKAFDLYFETENNDKRYFESTTMIMTIDVDSTEDLKVYRITDNDKLEEVEYTKLGDDKIEVETKGLGKYVLSTAKEKKDDTKKVEKHKQAPEKTSEIPQDEEMNIYLSILGITLIIVSILLIIKAKRRKSKYVNYVI